MKNANPFNLKNMKETIVNYSGDQKEFEEIWDAFYQMACIGFISRDTWIEFFNQCAGWYVDEEHACVRDARNFREGVDPVVWEYTPYSVYHA